MLKKNNFFPPIIGDYFGYWNHAIHSRKREREKSCPLEEKMLVISRINCGNLKNCPHEPDPGEERYVSQDRLLDTPPMTYYRSDSPPRDSCAAYCSFFHSRREII